MTSTVQRSLAKLRAEGWFCAVVEHWNQFCKRRMDLFGFADIICFRGDTVLLVQTTSGDHVTARVTKIMGIQAAHLWLESSHRRIVVHGWAKRGGRGERKLWTCREVEVEREPIIDGEHLRGWRNAAGTGTGHISFRNTDAILTPGGNE